MFPMTFLFLGGRLAVDLLNTVIAGDLLRRREDVAALGAAAGGGGALRALPRGGPGGPPARGRHIVNVPPAPSGLSPLMSPPCSSARKGGIARPSPLPPRSRLRD